MKKTKNIIWIIALILVIILIGVVAYGYYKNATMEVKNPIVTMEVENYGTIKMELYPENAPETVANFITLANRGFYNGLTFHRIVKDFMIQGGDPKGDGTGSAKISDKLKFEEGTVAMARSDYTSYSPSLAEESYNSGSSQFFIMTKENPSLNGQYTSFGKVIEGMDVVHKIENTEVKAADNSEETGNTEVSTPVNPPKITSIKVETNGVEYGLPETLTPFDYMSWLYKQYGIDPSTLPTGE
mgnify:CR=1 FL=1